MHELKVPLINANEDEVEVVEVAVQSGDEIRPGDLICVVESTKATFDVEAPAAGFIRRLNIEVGQRLPVGQRLALITDAVDTPLDDLDDDQALDDGLRITDGARALADEHQIDPADLDVDGIITRRHIEQLIGPSTARSADSLAAHRGERKLIIYGAGGHARVIIDLLRAARPDLRIAGIIDDGQNPPDQVFGIPVVGDSSGLATLHDAGVTDAVVGVGAVTHNATRRTLFERLVDQGFHLPNLIHPDASVEPSVRMGMGNQVFAGAVISSAAELGDNTIINSNTVVSHDCRIDSHTHLTPGALIAGGVSIGQNTVVGMGATVYLGVSIGDDVTISNGVDVMRDISDGTTLRSSRQ